MTRLLIQALCIRRGDRVLVPTLDLAVTSGELLHVRGANGSGKTTLLEMLAGLRPAEGIRREPEDMPLHWIGHRNALASHLSPIENLQFWCGVNGVDAAGVVPALERMRLPPAARRRPVRMLSAGQKRRSALARLLLVQRPLWLLDEPLDGLDRDGIAILGELLSAHVRAGGLVVMTSHQALPANLPSVREIELGRGMM